jgi:hypothetical protein
LLFNVTFWVAASLTLFAPRNDEHRLHAVTKRAPTNTAPTIEP